MHSEALNGGFTILLAGVAVITSFFLPAEISVLLLVLSYPTAIYTIGLMAGNEGGRYKSALSFFWKLFIVTFVVFSVVYWRYGLMHQGEHIQISVLEAAYFSVTTLTTLGYGDFAPPPRIRHITSIQAIVGYVSLGLWIGLISKLIDELDAMRREINDHNRNLKSSSTTTDSSK
jgi:predicted neutral ceramidase superfamily lipid hydrolase